MGRGRASIVRAAALVAMVGFAIAAKDQTGFCPTVATKGDDRRPDKNILKFASYNQKFLFIDMWNRSLAGYSSQAEAITHGKTQASLIMQLDADVVVMPEVDNCITLQTFLSYMNASFAAMYKPYVFKGDDSSTGQNVALLTRVDPVADLEFDEDRADYPVPGSTCGYNETGTSSGVSKNVFVRLAPANFPEILLVGVHFIAFPTVPDRCAQREAQATVIVGGIQERRGSQEVIVAGDFNDYDDEILDFEDEKPLSTAMGILKSRAGLKATMDRIEKDKRYSSCYGTCRKNDTNSCSMIDHVLVSPGLLKYIKSVSVEHFFPACGMNASETDSDHYPVIVVFDAALGASAGSRQSALESLSARILFAASLVLALALWQPSAPLGVEGPRRSFG